MRLLAEAERQAKFEQHFGDLHLFTDTTANHEPEHSPDRKSVYGVDEELPVSARRDSDPLTSPLGLLRKKGYHITSPPRSSNPDEGAVPDPRSSSPDSSLLSPSHLKGVAEEQG